MILQPNWGQSEKGPKGRRKKNVERLKHENKGRDSRNEHKTYFDTSRKCNQWDLVIDLIWGMKKKGKIKDDYQFCGLKK